MDTTKNIDPACCGHIKCYTCKDGFVCRKCILDVDPSGSIFLESRQEVIRAIRCPCCRTPNWNYQYNQLVRVILGNKLYENPPKMNDALRVWYKNYYERQDYYICTGCGDEKQGEPTYSLCDEFFALCEECWT